MADRIHYGGEDKWKKKATELLNQGTGGGGNVDDVKVNGTSVVDANKVAQIDLTPYAKSADLATVATSGSYNDLSNKPSIPAAQVNSDWNASSGVAQILNKPTLATVATSGSYNDLSNKPTDATQSASGLMSSTDKTKLDGIASGAEVNVQSDWSQSDSTADDYIKNKPNTTYTGNGNIAVTNNVVTRKEVWLTMAEYTALQNPDADTDYHITDGTYPVADQLPITVVNGKLCYHFRREVT